MWVLSESDKSDFVFTSDCIPGIKKSAKSHSNKIKAILSHPCTKIISERRKIAEGELWLAYDASESGDQAIYLCTNNHVSKLLFDLASLTFSIL